MDLKRILHKIKLFVKKKCYRRKIMDTVKFDRKNTLVVAHRGVSGIETENTAAAFIAAGNRSYYGVETDIYRTIDGRFVCNHDGNLLRIAGENIAVEGASLSTLQSIVLYDKDGTKGRADLRPASLENYISICKKYGKHCVLELKSDFTDEETERFIEVIKKLDYIDGVTFISFNYENLVKVRRVLPGHSVQFLFSKVTDEIVEKVIKDKFDVDVNYKALTDEVIERFHAAGVKINCWTVDTVEDAERLAEKGVEYITSNILE